MAKTAFSVAEATFEVRARRWYIRSRGNDRLLALAGTKQVRSDAIDAFGAVEPHFIFRG